MLPHVNHSFQPLKVCGLTDVGVELNSIGGSTLGSTLKLL